MESLTLFPNPATQMVYVTIPPEEEMMTIHISDPQGQEIIQQNIQNGAVFQSFQCPLVHHDSGQYRFWQGLCQ